MMGRAATLVIVFLIVAPLAVGAIYVVAYLFAHAFMAAGVVAEAGVDADTVAARVALIGGLLFAAFCGLGAASEGDVVHRR